MTKRFVCYFDDIMKKWCVQDTDSLDMHYVADEPMGEEFALLLNLYHQTLDNVEKENEQLKEEINKYDKKIKIMGNAFLYAEDLIDVEEVFFTEVYEPSENFDEELLCEFSNLFFSDYLSDNDD